MGIWRCAAAKIEFLKKGGQVLISKHKYFYYDMSYATYPLSQVYKYSPEMIKIPQECKSQIVGVEGALWSEWIQSFDKLEFQAFPRLTAMADFAWTNSKSDYVEFLDRLKEFNKTLAALKVNFANTKLADPKNPFTRLKRMKTWAFKDENVEYDKN